MKNLVSFKLFESVTFSETFINDIKDIALDFIDNGFDVDFIFVDYHKEGEKYTIKTFCIDIESELFRWEDIEDTVLRINDISKQLGYQIDIEVVSENEFPTLDDFISIYGSEELNKISILIYKL